MPKIFEYFGFIFFFFSNEHEPIHVHVMHNDCGTVFDLIIENGELKDIQERAAHGMDALSARDNKTARRFIERYHKRIVEKWVNFFVKKKVVRCTNIKVRL